jgi:hypothetical protein
VTDQRSQIAKAIADVFSRGSYASAGDPFGLKASSLAAANAVLAVLDKANPTRPLAERIDHPDDDAERGRIALGMVFASEDWAAEYLRVRSEVQRLEALVRAYADPGPSATAASGSSASP